MQVSTGGGRLPVWSPDGKELYFVSPELRLMSSHYTIEGRSFVHSRPAVWTETPLASAGVFYNYDVAPDGRRVAAMVAAETPDFRSSPASVSLLLTFDRELALRTPRTR